MKYRNQLILSIALILSIIFLTIFNLGILSVVGIGILIPLFCCFYIGVISTSKKDLITSIVFAIIIYSIVAYFALNYIDVDSIISASNGSFSFDVENNGGIISSLLSTSFLFGFFSSVTYLLKKKYLAKRK